MTTAIAIRLAMGAVLMGVGWGYRFAIFCERTRCDHIDSAQVFDSRWLATGTVLGGLILLLTCVL